MSTVEVLPNANKDRDKQADFSAPEKTASERKPAIHFVKHLSFNKQKYSKYRNFSESCYSAKYAADQGSNLSQH